MRYLNYFYWGDDIIELTLNHLEALVSLSTRKFKILNMSKCINLKNLYSEENPYKSNDIIPLKNLHRIYSYND